MRRFDINPDKPAWPSLKEVADMVTQGGTMIYPTDTIYGIGCDAYHKEALKKISLAKGRDPKKPFSFICRDVAQVSQFAFVPNWAYRLMTRILPGPYTFVLEARKTNLPKKLVGKRNTVGVRIPDHPVCHTLMELIDAPLVTTSVNLAGAAPMTDPADLPDAFAPYVDAFIDVGPIYAEPSTVLDATGNKPVTLREGGGEIVW